MPSKNKNMFSVFPMVVPRVFLSLSGKKKTMSVHAEPKKNCTIPGPDLREHTRTQNKKKTAQTNPLGLHCVLPSERKVG